MVMFSYTAKSGSLQRKGRGSQTPPGGGSIITLLNTNFDNFPLSNPISLANFRTAVGNSSAGSTSAVARTSVVTSTGHGNVMNQHHTAGLFGPSDGIGLNVPLSTQVDEATIQYDVRFVGTADYVSKTNTGMWGGGGKLPGLGGVASAEAAAAGQPTNPPTGGNPSIYGWTSRFMWFSPKYASTAVAGKQNTMVAYVYDPTQGTPSNTVYGQDRWPNPYGSACFIKNQWHTIKQYHKMNTINVEGVSGNADGIHRMWFDGVLVFESYSQVYRVFENGNITHLEWSNFLGGSTSDWATNADMDVQFDNILITTPGP